MLGKGLVYKGLININRQIELKHLGLEMPILPYTLWLWWRDMYQRSNFDIHLHVYN